ncbi:hypothetical protein CCY99_00950 [Helicobacter sp. 16-1353]|uniref:YceI family protein n=1 Tax=Helicobacter sp. 16-1353 TaxID=2004996 RepID=UPI000DCB6DD4|nr:YceI family protein [Helicobacter sp. 16-1353]RAX55299.1 hypothetical protein CCY99_00950 [Helicobacter sp. 16-1353]
MKKILICLYFVSAVFGSNNIEIPTSDNSLKVSNNGIKRYVVDNSSYIGFKSHKFAFVGVEGYFKTFSGNLALNSDGSIASLDGEIIIKSVFSDDEERDAHLLEADFLDEAKYPKGFLQSKKIEVTDGKVHILCDLTLHGKTQEVPFTGVIGEKDGKLSLDLEAKIDIRDFEIQGSAIVSDSLSIILKTLWNEI